MQRMNRIFFLLLLFLPLLVTATIESDIQEGEYISYLQERSRIAYSALAVSVPLASIGLIYLFRKGKNLVQLFKERTSKYFREK